jgi:beta-glucosidase
VYITDLVSSVVTPNQELVGFQKVDIPYVTSSPSHSVRVNESWYLVRAGGSKTVSIEVLCSQLAVWTTQNKWGVEQGQFMVKIGTSDQIFAQTTLTVR